MQKSLILNLHSTMFIFISVLQDVIKRDCLHLHSTMFIFIFALALERFTEGSYLHSTMFIFISDQLNYLIPSDVFTFHYVYIYITPQVTS